MKEKKIKESTSWVRADERKPEIPCVAVTGCSRIPTFVGKLLCVGKEDGRVLYFDGDILKAFRSYETIPECNRITHWLPIIKPPEVNE